MKNVVSCKNCKHENPIYSFTCENCNAYLHSRIANIDLWDSLWKIIETPVKAATTIIQSDHKNFMITILILAAFKIGINSLVLSNAFEIINPSIEKGLGFIVFSALLFIIMILIVSLSITSLNSFFGIKNRFKDNLAIFTYSFLPLVVFFAFITPIQIALFGMYWFSFNPSPLIFKPMSAYVIFILEGAFLIWGCVLFVTSIYAQTKNLIYSLIFGCGLFIISLLGVYFLLIILY